MFEKLAQVELEGGPRGRCQRFGPGGGLIAVGRPPHHAPAYHTHAHHTLAHDTPAHNPPAHHAHARHTLAHGPARVWSHCRAIGPYRPLRPTLPTPLTVP